MCQIMCSVVCVYVFVCVCVCVVCVCMCIAYITTQAVTDSGLLMITQHCHQLQQLNISGCDQLTDLSLRHLGTGCPHLR